MAQTEVYLVLEENLNLENNSAVLVNDEAHHLQRVRRARQGDILFLINGKGNAWKAQYKSGDKTTANCTLLETFSEWNEPRVKVHLGLGILKSDHFFEALNYTTQAGVCAVTPLHTRHSIAAFKDNKLARAARICLKAAKQTGRGLVPPVHSVQHLEEWCIQVGKNSKKFVLDENGGTPSPLEPGVNIALAVGPEGGFHPEELQHLKDAGFEPISLGYRRLRAETAAILGVGMLTIPLETETEI